MIPRRMETELYAFFGAFAKPWGDRPQRSRSRYHNAEDDINSQVMFARCYRKGTLHQRR